MRSYIALLTAGLCLAVGPLPAETKRPAQKHAPAQAKPQAKPKEQTKEKAPVRTAPSFDVEEVNNPATIKALGEKDAGSAALRAEILLDRANFSPGEIDGRIGMNALRAVTGFRIARMLAPAITIDADMWKALNMDTAPALVPYTISADDLKGPFAPVPAEMMAKAKLDYLGYASPLEGIAEKFHISPALLQRLNPGRTFRTQGEQIMVPNVLTQVNAQAAKIVVSRSASTITVFDDSGRIIAQYPCTSGSEHDPLPIGDWKITGIGKNPKFHYNPDLFWDAKGTDSKATIQAGPRNPVGVVWIDLSKEHYGIHGTPSPSLIGYTQSHGCIRLTNWDAMELAGMVKPGTPAILTE